MVPKKTCFKRGLCFSHQLVSSADKGWEKFGLLEEVPTVRKAPGHRELHHCSPFVQGDGSEFVLLKIEFIVQNISITKASIEIYFN